MLRLQAEPIGFKFSYDTVTATRKWLLLCVLQVSLQAVSASYINPSVLDTCEEYSFKVLTGLQASLDAAAGVSALNGTAVRVAGPASITVLVQDGGKQANGGSCLPAACLGQWPC